MAGRKRFVRTFALALVLVVSAILASSGLPAAAASSTGYRTACGTVYGHTGNTAGFTQFIAASSDGQRSVSVSTNAQITPKSKATRFKDLRKIYELGVCAALADS